MAERPGILRGLRAADALALGLCALALTTSDASAAAGPRACRAQPQRRARRRLLGPHRRPGDPGARRDGRPRCPGVTRRSATGLVAWRETDQIVVAALDTLAPVATSRPAASTRSRVSPRWLAWRSRGPAGDAYGVFDLSAPATPPRVVASELAPAELGRPALAGDALVFHVATRTGSRIDALDLTDRCAHPGAQRAPRPVDEPRRARRRAGLRALDVHAPAAPPRAADATGRRAATACCSRRCRPAAATSNHEKGHKRHTEGPKSPQPLSPRPKPGVSATLWTTALDASAAYVTNLVQRRGKPLEATILRVAR